MKHLITIGEALPQGTDERGGAITLDIDELIRSKALIQGNSGAGKSGLIRVIVEQINLRVPTLIIDPESEFASLREKLDMVLVADNGELKPDVRSAGLLARKLAELGASAILDLYELKGEQKHQWVKNFLEALMALPRKLWRPTLVVMDEAQLFAPEKGFGDSVALEAVQDWQFRGRKHGLGSILATPRLAALNKNVSGANNIFVGRTSLDVDVKRAAKLIGKSEKEATIELRELGKRRFFCFGPALNTSGVEPFYVADCETSIPQPGVHKSEKAPPASSAVEAIKDKLKDIEQEAEVEIKTLNDAKAEIAKLKREVKTLKAGQQPREQDTQRITELTAALEEAKQQTKTETKVVDKKIVVAGDLTRFEKALKRGENLNLELEALHGVFKEQIEKLSKTVIEAHEVNAMSLSVPAPAKQPTIHRVPPRPTPTGAVSAGPRPVAPRITGVSASADRDFDVASGNGEIAGLHQRVINGLAELGSFGVDQPNRNQLGFYLGKNFNSGYGSRTVGELKTWGLVDYPQPGCVSLTETGAARAQGFTPPSSLDEFHDRIRKHLSGLHLIIFDYLIPLYPKGVHRKTMGEDLKKNFESGYGSRTVGELKTAGLIKYPSSGQVAISDLLFPSDLS